MQAFWAVTSAWTPFSDGGMAGGGGGGAELLPRLSSNAEPSFPKHPSVCVLLRAVPSRVKGQAPVPAGPAFPLEYEHNSSGSRAAAYVVS